MKRQQTGLFFCLLACLLLSLLFCPPYDLSEDDKDVFRYAGMLLLKGGVPYKDLFDHKTPLIYFLNYTGLLLGPWGLWLLDLGMALFSTTLFYRLCRNYRLSFPWLLPLLFNLMIRDFLVTPGIGMTREYTAFFQLIFFCVLMGSHRYRLFCLGFLTALTFFMQQEQVLPLVPFLVYALPKTNVRQALSRVARMGIGFLAVTIPILLYLGSHHALADFWTDAILFNFQVYTAERPGVFTTFRTMKQFMDDGNFELPFLVSVISGVFALVLSNNKKALVVASLLAVVLSLAPEFMNVQAVKIGFTYYLTPLSASISCLLFVVWAFSRDPVLSDAKAQIIYGVLVCASLSYTAFQHATHLAEKSGYGASQAAYDYLKQHPPADYQLYVFADDDDIAAYNVFHILSPSKWIYHHFWEWYPLWDNDRSILRSIGQDLLRRKTAYVLMKRTDFDKFCDPAARRWWRTFLQDYYEPLLLPGEEKTTLWRLKTVNTGI
jgi:hypothetical protein